MNRHAFVLFCQGSAGHQCSAAVPFAAELEIVRAMSRSMNSTVTEVDREAIADMFIFCCRCCNCIKHVKKVTKEAPGRLLLNRLEAEQRRAMQTKVYLATSCPICFEDFAAPDSDAPIRPPRPHRGVPNAPPLPDCGGKSC